MSKKLFLRIIYIVLLLIVLAAEAFAMTALVRLDMLPVGYLIALIALFVLLSAGAAYLLLWKESKRRKIALSWRVSGR